jgi:hypothetical protein
MRGGTSRAAFFLQKDIPEDPETRDKVILAAFGSPDPDGRQIDGIGGAVSSTSKVAIISESTMSGTEINYLFGQVSITNPTIGYRGNCGNISSAVGPYAVDQGMIAALEPVTTIRIWQENTKKLIVAEVPVREGKHQVEGDYTIDGVPGTGAKINLTFFEPGGAVTDKLLPTGNVKDIVETEEYGTFTVSIVDASNAVVFVRARDLGLKGTETNLNSSPETLRKLEAIRSQAAVTMGVAPSPKEAKPNLPFIAVVCSATEYHTRSNQLIQPGYFDIVGRMLSMGKLHGAYPVTGAICTAGASKIEGTVVNEFMVEERLSEEEIRIGHPGGIVSVRATIERKVNDFKYVQATVGRTARRLAEGFVLVPEEFFK